MVGFKDALPDTLTPYSDGIFWACLLYTSYVCENAAYHLYSEDEAAKVLAEHDILVKVDMGTGDASAKAWGLSLIHICSGNPIFEAGNVSPVSIMDIVNDNDNSIYYIIKDLPEEDRKSVV